MLKGEAASINLIKYLGCPQFQHLRNP